jgi:hypothetical protein
MIVPINRLEAIKFLLSRKFPQLRVDAISAPGGNLLFKFGTYDKDLAAQAEQFRTELETMSVDEIQSLQASEQAKQQREFIEQRRLEEKKYFYNQPAAKADLDYWSKAAYWTLAEAAALCFDKSPELVNEKSLAPFRKVSPLADEYFKLLNLARRAMAWKELFDPVRPGIFLSWAKQNEIPYPQKLEEFARARGHFVVSWKTAYEELQKKNEKLISDYNKLHELHEQNTTTLVGAVNEVVAERNEAVAQRNEAQKQLRLLTEQSSKSIEPQSDADQVEHIEERERASLLRIIIAMASRHHRYHPERAKNTAAPKVVTAAALLGLKLSESTVLKYLKEASKQVNWSKIGDDEKP